MPVVSFSKKSAERSVDTELRKMGVSLQVLSLEPSLKQFQLILQNFLKLIEKLETCYHSKESALKEIKKTRTEISHLLSDYEKEDIEWAIDFMDEIIFDIEKVN